MKGNILKHVIVFIICNTFILRQTFKNRDTSGHPTHNTYLSELKIKTFKIQKIINTSTRILVK